MVSPAFFEHRCRQAAQERHALDQGGAEIELAVHRPGGDLLDLGAQAHVVGQLFEHFVVDHRRFHVGHQKLLAAAGGRLHREVDGGGADRGAHRRFDLRRVGAGEKDVAGAARIEPVDAVDPRPLLAEHPVGRPHQVEQGVVAGDEGEDVAHAVDRGYHGPPRVGASPPSWRSGWVFCGSSCSRRTAASTPISRSTCGRSWVFRRPRWAR